MDKKNLKKKSKPQKENKSIEDKENANASKKAPRFNNNNPPLAVVQAAPSTLDEEDGTPIPYDDWNFFASQYYIENTVDGQPPPKIINITNENYWKNLPEKDRKALASALAENRDLHNRITKLEDENTRLKALLEEARSLVNTITELLEEEGDDIWDELI